MAHTVVVAITPEAQKAAARAGELATAVHSYTLSPDQIGAALDLGARISSGGDVSLLYGVQSNGTPSWSDAAEPFLSRRPRDAGDALALIVETREALARALDDTARAALVEMERLPLGDYIGNLVHTVEKGRLTPDEAARLARRREAREAHEVARERERAAERERKKREEREEREREESSRLVWIAAHGSPRLQALVREGIAWTSVYDSERLIERDAALAQSHPGWALEFATCGHLGEARGASVTAPHLAALERARADIGAPSNIHLAWMEDGPHAACECVEHEHDEDCEDDCDEEHDVRQRLVLVADWTTPQGDTVEIVREIENGLRAPAPAPA